MDDFPLEMLLGVTDVCSTCQSAPAFIGGDLCHDCAHSLFDESLAVDLAFAVAETVDLCVG